MPALAGQSSSSPAGARSRHSSFEATATRTGPTVPVRRLRPRRAGRISCVWRKAAHGLMVAAAFGLRTGQGGGKPAEDKGQRMGMIAGQIAGAFWEFGKWWRIALFGLKRRYMTTALGPVWLFLPDLVFIAVVGAVFSASFAVTGDGLLRLCRFWLCGLGVHARFRRPRRKPLRDRSSAATAR